MDAPLLSAAVLALIAGLAMPLGAGLARVDDVRKALSPRVRHGITAFGGGALLSAVALVLVPEGSESWGALSATGLFIAGGIVFFLIDRALARQGGAGAQILAMMLDYLPEAAALGALLAVDPSTAVLLALMIFLQNLPEGFSAFEEIEGGSSWPARRLLGLFTALALLGPLCAAVGHLALADAPRVLGAIMLFAAGGILYLIFEDIAPAARQHGDGMPPLGAVGGFALGLLGHLAIG